MYSLKGGRFGTTEDGNADGGETANLNSAVPGRLPSDGAIYIAIMDPEKGSIVEKIRAIYEDNFMSQGEDGGFTVSAKLHRVRRLWSARNDEGEDAALPAVGQYLNGFLLFGLTPAELRPVSNLLSALVPKTPA